MLRLRLSRMRIHQNNSKYRIHSVNYNLFKFHKHSEIQHNIIKLHDSSETIFLWNWIQWLVEASSQHNNMLLTPQSAWGILIVWWNGNEIANAAHLLAFHSIDLEFWLLRNTKATRVLLAKLNLPSSGPNNSNTTCWLSLSSKHHYFKY